MAGCSVSVPALSEAENRWRNPFSFREVRNIDTVITNTEHAIGKQNTPKVGTGGKGRSESAQGLLSVGWAELGSRALG